jgi:ATP adenylyltransferase
MDHLWSPWRLEYVTRSKDADDGRCVFCKAPELPETDSLLVFSGTTCYIILNLYPYNSGHLMVVPFRHVASLAALTEAEMDEIGRLTQRCELALTEAFQPHGFNVGVNLGKSAGAGVLDHVHVHIVPRWSGDSNFMTVVGHTRVLPEGLDASAERLRPIFARLASEPSRT